MVPMHEPMRKGAFHEPHRFRVRTRIESGGGPPHSKTLARWPPWLELPPGFGVRRPCGALAMQASQSKAPQDWRSPRLLPRDPQVHGPNACGKKQKEALHEPHRPSTRSVPWGSGAEAARNKLRDCLTSPNRAKRLECVRFIGAFFPAPIARLKRVDVLHDTSWQQTHP